MSTESRKNGNELEHLHIYDFDSRSQLRVQYSNDMDVEAENNILVKKVSMSADGSSVDINVFDTNALDIFG